MRQEEVGIWSECHAQNAIDWNVINLVFVVWGGGAFCIGVLGVGIWASAFCAEI